MIMHLNTVLQSIVNFSIEKLKQVPQQCFWTCTECYKPFKFKEDMVAHLDEHMLPISSPRPKLTDTEDLTQETPPVAAISKHRARGRGTVGASTKSNRKKSTPTQAMVPVPVVKLQVHPKVKLQNKLSWKSMNVNFAIRF